MSHCCLLMQHAGFQSSHPASSFPGPANVHKEPLECGTHPIFSRNEAHLLASRTLCMYGRHSALNISQSLPLYLPLNPLSAMDLLHSSSHFSSVRFLGCDRSSPTSFRRRFFSVRSLHLIRSTFSSQLLKKQNKKKAIRIGKFSGQVFHSLIRRQSTTKSSKLLRMSLRGLVVFVWT